MSINIKTDNMIGNITIQSANSFNFEFNPFVVFVHFIQSTIIIRDIICSIIQLSKLIILIFD